MIEVLPLGAGQDVGRSCIMVSVAGKRVLFDCGMHMGYHDSRRFPDFSLIHPQSISAVVISHFHLDHCGALPFLTGIVGYEGPVIMTAPTKTICPLLLEDYRKIVVERRGEAVAPNAFFTSKMIDDCMRQVVVAELGKPLCIDGLLFTPFYAGHVLGAAMFLMQCGPFSCLYTGDFNMTPDRHLGAARVPVPLPLALPLDLLITETTYATTVRESKRSRERDFLRAVHQTVLKGGKVLIPTFALGRAQELCLLIDNYWTRMGIEGIPVYFSAGLAERATDYYGLHLDWTCESVKRGLPANPFAFRNIQPMKERHLAEQPGPMVLFSTPGMLHSGQSLQVFAKWAPDERNLLIIPGYCVAGTVGAKVLAGHSHIELESGAVVPVRLQIKNLSFSAHADSKGIRQLIRQCAARNVMLVHGERAKMAVLKDTIEKEFSVPCYDPPNGQYVYIAGNYNAAPVHCDIDAVARDRAREISAAAHVVYASDSFSESEKALFLQKSHAAQSGDRFKTRLSGSVDASGRWSLDSRASHRMFVEITLPVPDSLSTLLTLQPRLITKYHPEIAVVLDNGVLVARSLNVSCVDQASICVRWGVIDDHLGKAVLDMLKDVNN